MPDTPSVPDESSRLAQLTWLIALPATISAALLAATAGYLANGDHTVLQMLLAAAIVIVLGTAVYAIGKVRRGGERSAELRAMAVESRSGLLQSRSELTESRSELVETRAQLGDTRNELAGARAEIERLAERLRQAEAAPAPMPPPGHPSGRQVEVFVNLSRRLQSLVHREIKLLDALENEVEDPDLLKGLFQVDHLATRIRRHAENLAVLGGSVSRRQWSRPVALTEVLRSAIAEVEHYSRVKLVPPIEGTLPGHAVASVVHLIAELIENATMFAPPQTQVMLRAQRVAAGVAVEVEDRGLGMQRGDQERINQLLVNPDHINLDDLLRDGRIGLYVVSVIARQHGVVVQLQTNIYGGTQAIIILPQPLLDSQTTAGHLRPGAARPESLTELTTEIPQQSSWPVSPPPAAQPLAAQPFAAQPLAAQPSAAQPLAAQPFAAQPLAAQPFAAQSSPAQSLPTRPSAAQPSAAQPSAAQPSAAQPLPGRPSAAQPSAAAQPFADRYAAQPFAEPYAAPATGAPQTATDLPTGPFAGSPARLSSGLSAGSFGDPGAGPSAGPFGEPPAGSSAGAFGESAAGPSNGSFGESAARSSNGSFGESGGRSAGSFGERAAGRSAGSFGEPAAGSPTGPLGEPTAGLSTGSFGEPAPGSSASPSAASFAGTLAEPTAGSSAQSSNGSSSGPSAGSSSGGPERPSTLPPLPRRRSQTHMVPQLQLGPPAPAPEPTGEHNPALMASFMHGVSQGEADPAGPDRL
ncbi:ATP-binding protein [Actinoplanes sp. NPDC051411]|uniref:ATP-binding protein n=1 Tax=Actinoplanes sp. NPDC051411 TaxID=3155522 RepID=UPI003424CB15